MWSKWPFLPRLMHGERERETVTAWTVGGWATEGNMDLGGDLRSGLWKASCVLLPLRLREPWGPPCPFWSHLGMCWSTSQALAWHPSCGGCVGRPPPSTAARPLCPVCGEAPPYAGATLKGSLNVSVGNNLSCPRPWQVHIHGDLHV